MTSSNMLVFLIFLFFITQAESEQKKSVDKIIIHVPYKIHKHHHTHTKYKVITIPTPKHENTIIYLKENQQETKPEAPTQESNFAPPHQQSAATLLQHLQNYKAKEEEPEEHQFSQATTDQKSLESSNQKFVPNYEFQTMVIPTHENMMPQFLLKPEQLPHETLKPKYVINPIFHHQHNFIPNFDYKTVFQFPQPFIPKYTINEKSPLKIPQDNEAHASHHEYKTFTGRRPKSVPYKVREELQESETGQLQKHQHQITTIRVPSHGKGKTYVHSGQKYNSKSIIKMIPADPNYEYEHVGYLVIDGNSRKIVGRNFKNEIRLNR